MNVDLGKRAVILGDGKPLYFENILEELKPFENDIVYLGGSLIEGMVDKYSRGMGNRYSDVDVYIIREHGRFCDTAADYDADTVRKIYFLDSLPVGLDIEVYDHSFVIEFASALKRFTPKAEERSWNSIVKQFPSGCSFSTMVTFMNRLKNSVCIRNNTGYDELRSMLDFRKFLHIRRDDYIVLIDNKYDDVLGNLEARQYDVALYCMRDIVLLQVSAVLTHECVSFDHGKWLPLKFANFAGQTGKYRELLAVYQELFRGCLSENSACEDAIRRALKICKATTEEILLGDLML